MTPGFGDAHVHPVSAGLGRLRCDLRGGHDEASYLEIEVGKVANLVVLDRDLFDRASGEIGEARVIATFIDGVAVHEDPALGG